MPSQVPDKRVYLRSQWYYFPGLGESPSSKYSNTLPGQKEKPLSMLDESYAYHEYMNIIFFKDYKKSMIFKKKIKKGVSGEYVSLVYKPIPNN